MPTKNKEQLEAEKKIAGEAAAGGEWVRAGMRIGIGTGSTVAYFIRALGRRVREEGLEIEGVATSEMSAELAEREGIRVVAPARKMRLDLDVDGADEIGPDLLLIKGGGGALTREKIVAAASRRVLIIADSSKVVERLGRFPLPVEVIRFAVPWVLDELDSWGPVLRLDGGARPVVTDQGNHLIDCHCGEIKEPREIAKRLDGVSGVVEHGLFLGMASDVLIADGSEVRVLRGDVLRGG